MSRFIRVAVLGGHGLLGSHVVAVMREAAVDVRAQTSERFRTPSDLNKYLQSAHVDAIINCIGYLGTDSATHLFVNACLPRLVGDWAIQHSVLFIQISTNAVFPADPENAWYPSDERSASTPYEVSKLIGEDPRAYVIRSSFIGRDRNGKGVFERILANKTFKDRVWNGVTALVLGQRLHEIVLERVGQCFAHVEHIHSPQSIRMSQIAAHVGRVVQGPTLTSDGRLLAGGKPNAHFWDQLREYHHWLSAGRLAGVEAW